jgi:hypothetical protein
MSKIDLPTETAALEDARRRNRIGIIVIVIALILTGFAWTGLSIKGALSALHF